jgi:hypothetical protein
MVATHVILSARDRLQVVWINAIPDSAQVIQVVVLGDKPAYLQEQPAMNVYAPAIYIQARIASVGLCTAPEPAPTLTNTNVLPYAIDSPTPHAVQPAPIHCGPMSPKLIQGFCLTAYSTRLPNTHVYHSSLTCTGLSGSRPAISQLSQSSRLQCSIRRTEPSCICTVAMDANRQDMHRAGSISVTMRRWLSGTSPSSWTYWTCTPDIGESGSANA